MFGSTYAAWNADAIAGPSIASTSTVRMNPVMRLVSVASAIDPEVLTMLASESRARPVDDEVSASEVSVFGVSVFGVSGKSGAVLSGSRDCVAVDAEAAVRAAGVGAGRAGGFVG
ncbi:hypothetical protein GOSPT_062_00610 [Gordonia sputi NBRC 100414]|uniref:Uncharacterized protein n=1 Tax=Gordonia sputi NBRC 100414 TaxID=1089453 RepID=H5U0Q8_9ACTN|nr:hypothetical protein GOSPT_062_00610 [Gordonia sputi NBRC 100414]